MTKDADPNYLRAVQRADAERAARIKAERRISAMQAQNIRLRRALVRLQQEHKAAVAQQSPNLTPA